MRASGAQPSGQITPWQPRAYNAPGPARHQINLSEKSHHCPAKNSLPVASLCQMIALAVIRGQLDAH
eukprot:scaffold662261_cov62-Prasinocladus_malaysianus.AAC.1